MCILVRSIFTIDLRLWTPLFVLQETPTGVYRLRSDDMNDTGT